MAEPPNKDDSGAEQATTWIAHDPSETIELEAEPVSQAVEPVARRGSGVPWMLSGVLLVLVAAGATYLSWPAWNQNLPSWLRAAMTPVMDAGRNTALSGRVLALETSLDQLESQVKLGRQAADKETLAAVGMLARHLSEVETGLASRIATLELESAKTIVAKENAGRDSLAPMARRVAELEKRLAKAIKSPTYASAPARSGAELDRLRTHNRALAASMAELTRRLAALETRPLVAPAPLSVGSLLLAVGQLRDRIRNSGPYRRELDAVAALAAGDRKALALVAELAPHAGDGIDSLATLSAEFPTMARRVSQAALAPEDGGWIDQTMARLTRIITIRRTGAGVKGDGDGARLARAETRIKAGDFAGAVAQLEGLQGATAKAAGNWLTVARARLGAEDAMSRLTAHVITGLPTGRAGGPAAGNPGG